MLLAQLGHKRKRLSRLARRMGLDGRRGVVVACVAVALCAGGIGAIRSATAVGVVIERDVETASGDNAGESETDVVTQETYVVHVDGAVGAPGVYEVTGAEPRVIDAVEEAGGLLDSADTSGINLASPLVDGSKIHVPEAGEQGEPVVTETGSHVSGGLININIAGESELMALPGVGEATAAAIIRDRETNGPFASAEDIMRVSGIGEKKYDRMKDMICV